MKELHGAASTSVSAPAQQCYALLADIDGYHAWYPDVIRSSEVLERGADEQPVRAHAVLHVAVGPLVRDFNLQLAVSTDAPSLVKLERIPHDASDPERFVVTWTVRPGAIAVSLDASLSVPRLLPIGSIGETMAQGFVTAAARALA